MATYIWPVSSGVVVAMVNGRLRLTFPVAVLDTPQLRNPANYVISGKPTGAPDISAFDVRVLSDQTVDIGLSGKMVQGTYTLTLALNTARSLVDGVGNPSYSVTFAGVMTQYHQPLSLSVATAAKSLMGAGLSYPLRLGSDGELVKVAGEDNVDECLAQLIRTEQGERPFAQRDGKLYGTRLRAILFENGTEATALAFQTINEAIAIWEPRVRLLELTVDEDTNSAGGSKIFVSIKYLVIASSNVRNIIFPFLLSK